MRVLTDGRNLLPGREGRRLRWTIDVQQPSRLALIQDLPYPLRLDCLATKQKVPQPTEGSREFTGHVVEEGRRQEQGGDAVFFELCSQRVGRKSDVFLDDDEACAR